MTMPSLSLSFTLILSFILIHTSIIVLSSNNQDAILYAPNNNLTESCDVPCNATCQICENNKCIIASNSCYIGDQCFIENEIARNGSVLCLQCQPKQNQTQWSFNPICSAGASCYSESFRNKSTCPDNIIETFYKNFTTAEMDLYNFTNCDQNRKQCQAGFFMIENDPKPLACCAGYFCPAGQVCMIPCRPGSYCPSPLKAVDGTCEIPMACKNDQPRGFEYHGCGGSTFESFCPTGSYCSNTIMSNYCTDSTSYCPIGVVKPLPCPTNFECINGVAHTGHLFIVVIGTVLTFLVLFIVCVKISESNALKKILCGQKTSLNPEGASRYFKKRNVLDNSQPQFQLNINLYRAQLRDVTRFDPELNEGFTGRIVAGRITALMGGSGCGKSSLLDTIHGRRRLRNGSITFGEHEPLSTLLTDYIGYVPQADIMHDDLTVFETVYYSARTRRLGDSKTIIRNDVAFVLQTLGLKNMHNSMTRTLSGGQRKRVNVAMEVVACPKVLLLDEPTSGLDTASCDDLFDLLELIKYSEDGPVTIIMVIHQPSFELFQRIDDIFFLTPQCCLAYQGPREEAYEHLKKAIFENNLRDCPPPRLNESDTCFIILTKAEKHINNHRQTVEIYDQYLHTYSWRKRVWLPFFYVMSRSAKQIYMRCVVAEATYILAYFLLGACLGYLFENQQQNACDIVQLPSIYFLISLAFGILTCISSQRLFGVEIINKTYERESRNYFHPFQYWLAKSLIDLFRLIFYPLCFLSILYIQVVPRAPFYSYFNVMLLLSFVCCGIGQFSSVVFSRTEYAYLGGTIIALLSCLLSGFSPRKKELGHLSFITTFSFSRHVQHLLFDHDTSMYIQEAGTIPHRWSTFVEGFRLEFSFDDKEIPYFWLIIIGIGLRIATLRASLYQIRIPVQTPFLYSECCAHFTKSIML